MAIYIRRRELIATLGSAIAWPVAARAQQQTMPPVIGWLSTERREDEDYRVAPFRQGLEEAGYVEGQNLTIEYRFAEGQYDRVPMLAADLVRRQVSVIAAGGVVAARAAKEATATTPIVFQIADDPVQLGFVASLGRPGGNITGVTSLNVEVAPKQLELVHELVPTATSIALLVNPDSPTQTESAMRGAHAAARRLGLELHVVQARTERDFDTVFETLVKLRTGALVIVPDSLFTTRREQLGELVFRHAVPAISPYREFAAAGGLMSYGTNIPNLYRQVGIYTSRILKGEKPADLAVQQAVKLDLIINLKSAKALGLDVPMSMLMRVDEVVE
jgi:putative tryptophan/tyrosine transport system substrate-binding protein